ncbi:hypothetical protein [Lentibacillus sp. JNUCC-1]|uniref:hypothetical protein n=1 Tax=Lentibacillus sp. JNUCC-1 TaxID=2654513 RepID=UPI0012E8CB29|nr:hypothetical protein [Lentibacillus sp. JNUCC-1]
MKRIIMIGLASILLLSSVTVVYASSDSKAGLQNWYETIAFKQSSEKRTGIGDRLSIAEGLAQAITGAKKDIKIFSADTVLHWEQDIENHQKEYLRRLSKTKKVLLGKNFDQYTQSKEAEINAEITADIEDYLADLLSE